MHDDWDARRLAGSPSSHTARGSLPPGEGSAQRRARPPMHGWLHREQYGDVKTRDYRKLSIILSNLKPACATFFFIFLSAAKKFHVVSCVRTGRGADSATKENKISSTRGRIQELPADGVEFQDLVAAPETCFNSCVCVFGGTLPRGNIFPFYCFK